MDQMQPRMDGQGEPSPLRHSSLPKRGRLDVYEEVTNQILARIEKGVVPWQSPSIARVGYPRNFLTKKPYSGINVFLLGCLEFQSPHFLTFRQALELGGNVRKGEKGFHIIKVGSWKKEGANEEEKTEERKFLRLYTVFNSCQIEGISFPEPPKCEAFTETEQTESARKIVAEMPQRPLIHEGRKSYPHYVPDDDVIEMPSRESFHSEWRFYKTLFHELAHATGHEKRLNRQSLTENRGRYAVGEDEKTYCLEELVAEMTAAFVCASAGMTAEGFENSAAYLHGWLSALKVKDNRTWLVKAASEAQRAADFILGRNRDEES